jgi:hypothetical protein
MKKNVKPGYNGMAMAYIGTGDRYGGMVNLNVKEGKWNFTTMYSHNQAMNNTKGYTRRTQLDSLENASGYFNQDNKVRQTNMFDFGKLGVDYSINNRNTISLSGMVVSGQFKTHDEQVYQVQDASKTERLYGDRLNEQNAAFQHYNGQLLYKKTFPKIGKEFIWQRDWQPG